MRKRAQSILEYAVFIAVIAVALMTMQEYVNRAINAKLKDVQDAIYEQGTPGVTLPGAHSYYTSPTGGGSGE